MPNLRRAMALGAVAMAAAGAVVFASPAANAADNAGPPGLPDCSASNYDDGGANGVFDFLNNFANGDPGAPDLQAVCPMTRFLPPLNYGGRDGGPFDGRYDNRDASHTDGHDSASHDSDSHDSDSHDAASHDADSRHHSSSDSARDSSAPSSSSDRGRDSDNGRDNGPRLFPFYNGPRFF